MAELIRIPVLIVGGGPVGLVLTIGLAWRGIRSILVNREPETPAHPKGNTLSSRMMEYFRKLGFADEIRSLGLPPEEPTDVGFYTRLGGHEIARFHYPSRRDALEMRRNPVSVTPEPTHRANQLYTEATIKKQLDPREECEQRFGWILESFKQDEDGVDAVLQLGGDGKKAAGPQRLLVVVNFQMIDVS